MVVRLERTAKCYVLNAITVKVPEMNKKDKCPTCKCTETKTHTVTHDQGFIEETWTECKKCKRLKHHWSYGCLFVDNWKDMSQEVENE